MRHSRTTVMLLLVALTAAACSRKRPAEPQPMQEAPPSTPTSQPVQPATRASDDDSEGRAAEARIREALGAMVFFDYDRSDLRSDARPVLEEKARILRDQPSVRLRIEGHADERGSVEYNLALGVRRANAVREYLVGFGIEGSRLDVISYGEERPLSAGASEDSYARNRRASFDITGGSITVR